MRGRDARSPRGCGITEGACAGAGPGRLAIRRGPRSPTRSPATCGPKDWLRCGWRRGPSAMTTPTHAPRWSSRISARGAPRRRAGSSGHLLGGRDRVRLELLQCARRRPHRMGSHGLGRPRPILVSRHRRRRAPGRGPADREPHPARRPAVRLYRHTALPVRGGGHQHRSRRHRPPRLPARGADLSCSFRPLLHAGGAGRRGGGRDVARARAVGRRALSGVEPGDGIRLVALVVEGAAPPPQLEVVTQRTVPNLVTVSGVLDASVR